MDIKLTKKQLEVLLYIEGEHLPFLIEEGEEGGYILNEDLIPSLRSHLLKMQVLTAVCTRILEKLPPKKSTLSRGGAHNPPPQKSRPSLAEVPTTPLPISAGGYTIFKWSMEKYKDPEGVQKVLDDLNLEVEDGWITCHDSLLKTVHHALEKILINSGDDFFLELDSVLHLV